MLRNRKGLVSIVAALVVLAAPATATAVTPKGGASFSGSVPGQVKSNNKVSLKVAANSKTAEIEACSSGKQKVDIKSGKFSFKYNPGIKVLKGSGTFVSAKKVKITIEPGAACSALERKTTVTLTAR